MESDLHNLHEEFMNECKYSKGLAEATLRGYVCSFSMLMQMMPDLTTATLCPKLMTEFFKRLDQRERKVGKNQVKSGIKNSTVATYRSKLSKFFTWLAEHKHIEENPFDKMDYPSVEYEDRKFLHKEEVEKIMTTLVMRDSANQLVRKRNLAMFTMLLCCGLRRGELLGIKVVDIDLKRRELVVRAETSKSKRERYVPLNSKVTMALQDYFDERSKLGYVDPKLWVSMGDKPFTEHGLKHLVEVLKKESGVDFHLHRFRHTFAVGLLNNDTDVAKLKQLMGHRDIRMTAGYLRCLPTRAMRADVEMLGNLDNLL